MPVAEARDENASSSEGDDAEVGNLDLPLYSIKGGRISQPSTMKFDRRVVGCHNYCDYC